MAKETHTLRTTVSDADASTGLLKTDVQDDSGHHYDTTVREHEGQFKVSLKSKNDKNKKSPSSPDVNCSRKTETAPAYFPIANQNGSTTSPKKIPLLTICMLVIGTRGDIQPFINFGRYLQKEGHRVRLATHRFYKRLVRRYGLEFFPLAGDPTQLMEYMVKSAGIVPSFSAIADGEISKHQRTFADILKTCWDACVADDPRTEAPFRADVIISNPPVYGHIHCAEKLQIPLHMLFTMPWTSTDAYPHPFCVPDSQSEIARGSSFNSLTFTVVDRLTWMGLGGCVNAFRRDTLHLSTLHARQATRALIDEQVAHTYCWSEKFIPRPRDWPPFINISGYFFDDDPPQWSAPDSLKEFLALDKETPPIYIGFGSIAGHDRIWILEALLKALNETNTRAIMHNLVKDEKLPTTVYPLSGNIDQNWLFRRVSAVCHHGGAGTMAVGLCAGRPTIIIPFFGDQFFNGHQIQCSRAGWCVFPRDRYNVQHLVQAITYVKSNKARQAAQVFQNGFSEENGCANALKFFDKDLSTCPFHSNLKDTYAARYTIKNMNLQVSLPVAQVLVLNGCLNEDQLQQLITRKWRFSEHGPLCVRRWRHAAQCRNHETGSHACLESHDKILREGNEIYVGCAQLFGISTAQIPPKYVGWYVRNSSPNGNSWVNEEGAITINSSMEMASLVSGYPIDMCERIVSDFKLHRQSAVEAIANENGLSTKLATMYMIEVCQDCQPPYI